MRPINGEILQLIAPTERTYAVYKIGDETELKPVILWALVRYTDKPDNIHGISDFGEDLEFCKEIANFIGYETIGEENGYNN